MSAVPITNTQYVAPSINSISSTEGPEPVDPIPVTCGPGDEEEEDEDPYYSPFKYPGTNINSRGHLGYVPVKGVVVQEHTDLVTGFEKLDEPDYFVVKIAHKGDPDKTKITLTMALNNPQDQLVSVGTSKSGENTILFPKSGCKCRCEQLGFVWDVEIKLVEGKNTLQYRFLSGEVFGEWAGNPTRAFKSIYMLKTGMGVPSYISGRMFVGIFYPEVQSIFKTRLMHN